jgi:hypothetical protein
MSVPIAIMSFLIVRSTELSFYITNGSLHMHTHITRICLTRSNRNRRSNKTIPTNQQQQRRVNGWRHSMPNLNFPVRPLHTIQHHASLFILRNVYTKHACQRMASIQRGFLYISSCNSSLCLVSFAHLFSLIVPKSIKGKGCRLT